MARDYYVESLPFLASASRTTTTTGSTWSGTRAKGCTVVVDVTTAGTGSITASIEGIDANGIAFTILAGLAITTAVRNVYHVYPGVAAVANSRGDIALPLRWRVVITHNNANAITYSVGVEQHG